MEFRESLMMYVVVIVAILSIVCVLGMFVSSLRESYCPEHGKCRKKEKPPISNEYEKLKEDMDECYDILVKSSDRCYDVLSRGKLKVKDEKALRKVYRKLEESTELLHASGVRVDAMKEIVGNSLRYDEEVAKAQLEDKYKEELHGFQY